MNLISTPETKQTVSNLECRVCQKIANKKYSEKIEKERLSHFSEDKQAKIVKVCSKCGLEKNLTDFYKDKSKIDGFRTVCKICSDKQKKAYIENNRAIIFERRKKFREKNKEKLNENQKKYYEENKDILLEYGKEYRQANRNTLSEKTKEYRKRNADKIRRQRKEFRNRNKGVLRVTAKKYYEGAVPFDTFAPHLTVDEEPIADNDGKLLARCTYCGRHFYPTRGSVKARIEALKGMKGGGAYEARLYCSDNCKRTCPTYRKQLWPAGYKPSTSREVQPELRQMRLEIDDYECQKCGKTIDEAELHCHHYTGTMQNPIESADVDNTITVCKECHKWVHTQEGCRYFELRCT